MSESPTNVSVRKRKRLTFACNLCRSRKVKCDDNLPNCTTCVKAGVTCITTDPRQPGQTVQRREAQYRDPNDTLAPNARTAEGIVWSDGQSQLTSHGQQSSGRPSTVWSHEHDPEISRQSRPATPNSNSSSPLPVLPRFISGNSLQVLTQWLDLAFARIGVPLQLSSHDLESRNTSLSRMLPLLASSRTYSLTIVDILPLAKVYLSSINLIYPLFDSASVLDILRQNASISCSNSNPVATSSTSVIAILMVAVVETVGYTQSHHSLFDHVGAAYSMLSIIIAEASLRSTQALFLMVLVLRGLNEIEVAWHLLSIAVSIAQSLAMHRAISARRRVKLGESLAEEYVRTWWALYSLEKMLSLEIEKPSSIQLSECNQSMPKLEQHPPIFDSIIKLAQLQSQINDRCIINRSSEENKTLWPQDVIREKIINQGELDQLLVAWEEELASELRPSNHLYCQPDLLPYISFMAIQYYQTMVLLHRNTLLVNKQTAQNEINRYCFDKPYLHRLRNGQMVCVNAARSIVSVLYNVHERQANTILNTVNAPLIAAYSLAIHTLKSPSSGLAKSDLELQAQAIVLVTKQRTLQQNHDSKTEELLATLQSEVSLAVEGATLNSSKATCPVPEKFDLLKSKTRSNGVENAQPSIADKCRSLGEPGMLDQSRSTHDASGFSGIDHNGTTAHTHYNDMDMINFYDQSSMLFEGSIDYAALDWDALAAAFDLPVYNR